MGALSLVLRPKSDGFAFTAQGEGRRPRDADTGKPRPDGRDRIRQDAATSPQAQFVQNRILAGKKNVLTLPKKKRASRPERGTGHAQDDPDVPHRGSDARRGACTRHAGDLHGHPARRRRRPFPFPNIGGVGLAIPVDIDAAAGRSRCIATPTRRRIPVARTQVRHQLRTDSAGSTGTRVRSTARSTRTAQVVIRRTSACGSSPTSPRRVGGVSPATSQRQLSRPACRRAPSPGRSCLFSGAALKARGSCASSAPTSSTSSDAPDGTRLTCKLSPVPDLASLPKGPTLASVKGW